MIYGWIVCGGLKDVSKAFALDGRNIWKDGVAIH